MALYVVVSEDCRKEAQKYGQTPFVDNLKAQVEKIQCLALFDSFLPTRFLKKGLGKSYRLIAYHYPIEEDELLLFLRVLPKGSREYDKFLNSLGKDIDQVTRQFQPFSEDQLRRIHADLIIDPPTPPPPEPNEEERRWLYEVLSEGAQAEDLLVLETEDWVKKMRAMESRDFLALYQKTFENLDLRGLRPSETNTECLTYRDATTHLGFAYVYRPDLLRLVLLEPLRDSDVGATVESLLKKYRDRLSGIQEGPTELSRIAARSYPFLMVLGQDAWLAIQKDDEANLALSPEEGALLESLRQAGAEGEFGYPLFINGRAGSGKSTMLQYLAADYVDFALRRRTSHLPLYMTCSPDLLDRARRTVRGLLTAHHKRLLQGSPPEPSKVDRLLESSFVVFHDFLYSLLPPETQKGLPKDKDHYVNYSVFRRLWSRDFAQRPEAKRISPDLAWHTIRSYIKGIRSSQEDELAPEEFIALPRRRRSVSVETYKEIYERVWVAWYKRLCDDGCWDDQDLAARVLEAGCAQGVDAAAVFCDEAQDFTPVELSIIFQLSLFGRRSLQPEELRRVPIVFAGDPLQTINPTGFRWDAVQADFHDRFCAVLDPRRRARVELSYKELHYNYRSNPGIVGFCNLIQLVRAALLGVQDIRPQEAWWVDAPVQTVWFAADTPQTRHQIQRHPELAKLVNCEEGEETEYVQEDSILRTLRKEEEGIYPNVLGPTRAKGLEFRAVLLYRFGETVPGDFARLLDAEGPLTEQEKERRLPYEYFFNRLYVAASRAKGQLIIVDSDPVLRGFWRIATDIERVERLMQRVGGVDLWRGSVAYPVPGGDAAWSGERIDPREQGDDYAAQGRRKRDPYLLRQAAIAYRSAGDEFEAGKCLALAAEIEGKYRDAGDRYDQLGLHSEAFRCYWEGHQWAPLRTLTALQPDLMSRLESRAADFMAGPAAIPPAFLEAIGRATNEEGWLKYVSRDATWRVVINELADRLAKEKDDAIGWADVWPAFRRLSDAGIPVSGEDLAAMAYRAGEFKEAVVLWDRIESRDKGQEYHRAKARVATFPENIISLARLKENGEILRQWREHAEKSPSGGPIDEAVMRAVVGAALDEGELDLAAEALRTRPDPGQLAKVLQVSLERGNVRTATTVAVIASRLFVRSGQWKVAIRAARKLDFSALPGIGPHDVHSLVGKTEGAVKVFQAVVRELAISDNLARAPSGRKQEVTEFLHHHFTGKDVSEFERYGLTAREVGAAIERAAKMVEALAFYEVLLSHASTRAEKEFAAERLVKNHERYAEHLQKPGSEAMVRERRERARRVREENGIGNRHIPEYPVLSESEDFLSPGLVESVHGPFKIVLSQPHLRLRIEHTKRFETVTVDGRACQLLGDAAFTPLQPTGRESAAWEVVGWNCVVKLFAEDRGRRVLIAPREGQPLEVQLGESQPQ